MLTPNEVLALVPQQRPFRFLDRLLEIDDEHVVGEYTFRRDESFFVGHFPGDPVTPGVILLESMCQTGLVALGIYLLERREALETVRQTVTLFTEANVEFSATVRPEDTVRIAARKVYFRRNKLRSDVTMTRPDGAPVAHGLVAGMGVRR